MAEPAVIPTTPAAALQALRSRLLDLTTRNRLLHYLHSRDGNLRIVGAAPDALHRRLLDGQEVRFQAVPDPTHDELIASGDLVIDPLTGAERGTQPKAASWATRKGLPTDLEAPDGAGPDSGDQRLQTLLYPAELETRMRGLRARAESAIEETGANICYVSFGFLEWFDNNANGQPRHAPLVMVPVRINKGRLNPRTRTYEYSITYTGEDLLANLTLKEKLRRDFALALPDLDEDTAPEPYLDGVARLVKQNQPTWQVRRWITICLLSFSKLLLYRDLDPDNWPPGRTISDHDLVRCLLGGATPTADNEPDRGLPVHPIDDLPMVHQDYPLIEDADSSQHSALIDAVDGRNLVIEGPPGTGKSQTITNLIAAALARGKRVLFVAEKLAALEVVKARLEQAGLGDFCLELHGHKTQKRRVLDDIDARITRQGSFQDAATLAAEIARYEGLKARLRDHAKRVNEGWCQTGFTIHQILTGATRHREALGIDPTLVHPDGYDGNQLTPAVRNAAQEALRVLSDVHGTVRAQLGPDATLAGHPWHGVGNRALMPFDTPKVCAKLLAWQAVLLGLRDGLQALVAALGGVDDPALWRFEGLSALVADLEGLPPLTGAEVPAALAFLHGDRIESLATQLARLDAINEHEQALSSGLVDGWRDLPDLTLQLRQASDWLTGLGVSGDVSLPGLATCHGRLDQLLLLAREVAVPMSAVAQRLPPPAAALLEPTPAGIAVFRDLLTLVAQLRAGLLSYRGTWCDDATLDDVLPELEERLTKLSKANAVLAKSFALEQLPAPEVLAGLRATLQRAGMFRWFNRNWREARRRLLDLAAPGQRPGLGRLLPALDNLCRYAAAKARLEQNPVWRAALGPHFAGLATPIADLRELRAWYRAVRQRFGVGFGPRVPVGDALIALEPALAQGLQSLVSQGVNDQIDRLFGHLSALREAFPNSEALASDQMPLTGPAATIATFGATLAIHLRCCQTRLQDANATVDTVAVLLAHLQTRDRLLRDWRTCTIDPAWFGGAVDLRVPPGELTPAAVGTAAATLGLAQAVERLQTDWLREAIRRQPTAALFASLRELSGRLASDLAGEATRREDFRALAIVSLDRRCLPAGAETEVDLPGLLARNQRALDQPAWLANWLDYLRARHDLATRGFARLAALIDRGGLRCEDALTGFNLAVFDLLAREILTTEPALAGFSGAEQGSLQRQFRECDERLKALQQQRLAMRIVAAHPVDPGTIGPVVADWTGLQLLKKETAKKTKHIPLRQLIDRAGDALAGLKPCFMMGPMSVAQYLKPGGIGFDLVVMDEASQLRPEDAIGAVARGTQLVVVGDPKQLPPTNFFQTVVDGDNNGDDALVVETTESILDAALPLFPTRTLCWHYRSRHESLIAFSNHHFYKNLVVFPSPNANTPEHGVRLTRVAEGRFVEQRNVEEATVVAEAVRAHLCGTATFSVGVVAMNAKQREQIERAVEDLAKEDALFRDRLEANRGTPEPLFIKNLENVQGDERDLILISCTYGPQTSGGPVPQRFGPITHQTGWRRLNVLFTRAKQGMHLFASMGADDVLVSASSSRGVRALRDFLAYAETGHLHQAQGTDRPPDSDFEIAVAAALAGAGFECAPQVGVAGFFIDLAVRDPGRPGRYLMGIECDGATYHSAKSVRDRDRLRQQILEGLGWRIRRIWSTDWYKNPQAELKPIIAELNQRKTQVPVPAPTPAPDPLGDRVALVAVTPNDTPVKPTAPPDDTRTEGATAAPPPRRGLPDARRTPRPRTPVEPPRQQLLGLEDRPAPAPVPAAVPGSDLRERLLQFDRDVIRPAAPDTPEERRLLRPAILTALLSHRPCDKGEFLDMIPAYLRESIAPAEGRWLADVLRIIESFD